MSIPEMLSFYGFVPTYRNTLYYGVGCLVWGYEAEIKTLGGNRYEVRRHDWFYGPDGEPLHDTEITEIIFGGEMMSRVMATIPAVYLFCRC